MIPTAAPIPGRPAIRPVLAGLTAFVLVASIGPMPAAEAGARSPAGHSCCCGPVCRAGCCCGPKGTDGDRPADRPSSAADIDDLFAVDPSPCIGPRPCGGDADAPPSLTSPRERPPALPSIVHLDLNAGRSPLPCSIERLRPALPGDPAEEPPEPAPAAVA